MPMSSRLLRPRAAVSAGFDPRSIGTMLGWWDASDASTVTLVNGFVSQWNDKSGNGLNVSQAAEAARPSVGTVNSRSAIYFDGSNDWLTGTGVSPAGTLILAVRPSRAGNETYFYNGVTTPAINVAAIGTGANNAVGCERRTASGFSSRQSSGSAAIGATSIYSATVFSEPPGLLRLNGAAGSTAASTSFGIVGNSAALAFGGASSNGLLARPFQGHICEVLFYAAELSAVAIVAAEQYLAAKWGATLYYPPAYADADVNAYITAVEAADGGVALEASVRDAINAFVTGCKTDGTWSAITTCHLFLGARTLAGAQVPLVGGALTNSNFVLADYARGGSAPGFKGDGSTKRFTFSRNPNLEPQNDFSFGFYASEGVTISGQVFSHAGGGSAGASLIQMYNASISRRVDAASRNVSSVTLASSLASQVGFFGTSRSSASGFDANTQGTSTTFTQASQTPAVGTAGLFARQDAIGFSNPRIAFAWFGRALNLSLLRDRVQTLVSSVSSIT